MWKGINRLMFCILHNEQKHSRFREWCQRVAMVGMILMQEFYSGRMYNKFVFGQCNRIVSALIFIACAANICKTLSTRISQSIILSELEFSIQFTTNYLFCCLLTILRKIVRNMEQYSSIIIMYNDEFWVLI